MVEGQADDDSGIDMIELFVGGTPVDETLLPSFDLRYAVPDDGVEGTDYQSEVVVRATDVSGNISEVSFFIQVIDDNPPEIAFITPQPGAEVSGGITISLNVSVVDDRTPEDVRFYEEGDLLGEGVLSSPNVYSIIYRVPEVTEDETRAFSVEATDNAGQISSAETFIIIKPYQTGPIVSVGDNAQAIDIQGDIAVTGGSNGVLNIYNIGIPSSPVLLGTIGLTENIKQLKVEGDRVYTANYYYMKTIDISDPSNPVLLSNVYSGYPYYSIDVFDEIAFTGGYAAYIRVYDMGDGQSPVLISTKDIGNGNITDVKIDGLTGMLYAVSDYAGASRLLFIDASDPANLVEMDRMIIPDNPTGVEVAGDRVYVTVTGGMLIIDRLGTADFGVDSDGDGMTDDILSYIETPGGAYDIGIKGDYAYIADGVYMGIRVIDTIYPSEPLDVAKIKTSGDPRALKVDGSYLFVADGNAGLSVLHMFASEISP